MRLLVGAIVSVEKAARDLVAGSDVALVSAGVVGDDGGDHDSAAERDRDPSDERDASVDRRGGRGAIEVVVILVPRVVRVYFATQR